MAACMWGNNLKDQCLKVRRLRSISHMKIVMHIQIHKLMKIRNINISPGRVLRTSSYSDLPNVAPLSFQSSNVRPTADNVCNLNVFSSVSAQTFGAVKSPHLSNTTSAVFQARWFSSDRSEPKKFQLMNFPPIIWPSPIKTIRNWILARLIITPYFDREFSLADFVEGSKQAVEVVSRRLSSADFEGLRGLVTPDALAELRSSISEFTLQQRLELVLSAEDMYFCFPHQVGIMFNDKDQRRYVEITMCYHVLRGLKELREQNVNPPLNMGLMPEYQDKLFICNYRFVRDYTRGTVDQWTINVANHFRPGEDSS